MNSAKFVKVFDSLVKIVGSKEAAKVAMRVAKDDKQIAKQERALAPTSNDSNSLKGRIMAFANKRKGAVWSLQNIARQLEVDPNSISAQLTKLCGEGRITRTGRGEYRRA